MGIDARMMPGGRCVVARLRLQRPIFRSSTTPFQIDEVTFASVGSDRAKCLRPRALFQLPIFRILDCRDTIAIEARIHLAWEKHRDALTKAQSWLHSLGATGEIEEEIPFTEPPEDRETNPAIEDAPIEEPATDPPASRVDMSWLTDTAKTLGLKGRDIVS